MTKPLLISESTRNDLSDSLARLVAHMVILGHQQRMQTIGPEQMVQAVVKGDIASVQQYIKLKKDLVIVSLDEDKPKPSRQTTQWQQNKMRTTRNKERNIVLGAN